MQQSLAVTKYLERGGLIVHIKVVTICSYLPTTPGITSGTYLGGRGV
jgi:hypothetical protein